jgi:CubicO group peptidase (beta-lactamase class C family)
MKANYETDSMKSKRPQRHSCKPGEQWYYNDWDFNVLGTAYQKQTGKTVFEGYNDELAKPLGFENFNTDRGASAGYGDLWWTSPDNTQFKFKFPAKVFSARGHFGQYLLVEP